MEHNALYQFRGLEMSDEDILLTTVSLKYQPLFYNKKNQTKNFKIKRRRQKASTSSLLSIACGLETGLRKKVYHAA